MSITLAGAYGSYRGISSYLLLLCPYAVSILEGEGPPWYYPFRGMAAGASRGWVGTYTYSFISTGVLCLLAAALSLRIRGHARTGPAAQPAVAQA
jgi:hypothetical protein